MQRHHLAPLRRIILPVLLAAAVPYAFLVQQLSYLTNDYLWKSGLVQGGGLGLVKPGTLKLEDTNVALIGSDMDKKLRQYAAATEPVRWIFFFSCCLAFIFFFFLTGMDECWQGSWY